MTNRKKIPKISRNSKSDKDAVLKSMRVSTGAPVGTGTNDLNICKWAVAGTDEDGIGDAWIGSTWGKGIILWGGFIKWGGWVGAGMIVVGLLLLSDGGLIIFDCVTNVVKKVWRR